MYNIKKQNIKKMLKIIFVVYFLLSSFSFANEISITSPVLKINGKYVDEFETKNIVFNEVYKEFIKSYEKDFKVLEENIISNNKKQDFPLKHLYLKVDESLKNFKYQGGDILKEKNSLLNQYSYELKRLTKNKLDYQEKEINLFLNNQIKNYGDTLKNVLSNYDITQEEKSFISDRSKKIITILNESIDKNKDYSKLKMVEFNKDLSSYQTVQNAYEYNLSFMNQEVDQKIFKDIWEYVRSNTKYPSIEE